MGFNDSKQSRQQRSLSLQRFARAKQTKYDKRKVIELNKTRKLINRKKVKKQLKNLSGAQDSKEEQIRNSPVRQPPQNVGSDEKYTDTEKVRQRKYKPKKTSLSILYEKHQKQKQEQEQNKNEELQRREELEQQKREKALRRNRQHVQHMKRNWKGQPIMKYQIEGILDKLEKERAINK